MKRTALIGVAGLALSALVAVPVSAAPTWVDPADLPDVEGVSQLHVTGFENLAGSSRGRVGTALVWVDQSSDDILATTREPGGTWSEPFLLADPAGEPAIEEVGSFYNLGPAAAYTVGSQLFVAGVGSYGDVVAPQPIADIVPGTFASDGSYNVAWAEGVDGGGQQLVATNGLANTHVVAPASDASFLDAAGVWVPNRWDGIQYALWISQAPADAPRVSARGWFSGTPQALSTAGATASSLTTGYPGMVAWTERVGAGPAKVRVAELDGDTEEWRVRDASTGVNDAAQPAVGITAGGDRVVTWREQVGDGWSVLSSQKATLGAPWPTPATVASGDGILEARQFATREGGAAAAWCRPTGAGCTMQAASTGSSPGPVATLGTVDDAAEVRIAPLTEAVAWTDGTPGVRIAALDAAAPLSVYPVVPAVTFTGAAKATWSGVDLWSEVSSYRFRTSDRSPHSTRPRWEWDSPIRTTTGTSRVIPVRPGTTRCIGVQGVDAVGNTRGFVGQYAGLGDCVTAPVNERALNHSKGWTKVADRGSYRHTLLRASKRGATLTFPRYALDRALVLVKRVPAGGTVEVRLGGRRIGTIDTSGPVRRQTAYLAKKRVFLQDRPRPLTIRVISRGKPVLVDGVILADYIHRAGVVNRLTRP